jgi:hypothetical protein
MNTTMAKGFIFLVCLLPSLCRAMPGENIEQLVKRFGKNYTFKAMGGGLVAFHIRSEKLNVDVVLNSQRVSEHEVYYSRVSLDGNGLPPHDALCKILKTYALGRWMEVDVPQLPKTHIDCSLRSEKSDYLAALYYSMHNVEGFKWIVLIEKVEGNRNYKANGKVYGCS